MVEQNKIKHDFFLILHAFLIKKSAGNEKHGVFFKCHIVGSILKTNADSRTDASTYQHHFMTCTINH